MALGASAKLEPTPSVSRPGASSAMLAQWEAEAESDASPVPAALRSWLADGLKILNAMTAEESAELLATVTPAVAVIEVIELADSGPRSASER